jgi:hypothetical protein
MITRRDLIKSGTAAFIAQRAGMMGQAAPAGATSATVAVDTVTQVGWIAPYAVALPRGAAHDLTFAGLSTQVDVKCRWDDGSIKHAIVTAKTASTGSLALNAGTSAGGTIRPTWPTVTVTLVQSNSPAGGGSGAATYVATLGSYDNSDPWLNGPNVNAASVWKSCMNGGTAHTNLKVRFDVYSFRDSTHVIDIAVENTLNNASNAQFIYGITIAVNGSTAYTEAAIYHLPFTVKTRQVTAGSPSIAQVSRDMTPFLKAAAFPQYLSDVQDMRTGGALQSLTDHGYDSMDGLGPFQLPMSSHGGRPEIGLINAWCVSWIVHQRYEQYAFIQKLTEYAGNYCIHMRKSDNSDIYRITNGDLTWLNDVSSRAYLPACGAAAFQPTPMSVTLTSDGTAATATVRGGVPGYLSVGQFFQLQGVSDGAWNGVTFSVASIPSGTTLTFTAPNGRTTLTGTITANILPPSGELAHLPSMAYVQYLVSGRRRAMDEMVYYANFALLYTQPETRGFGFGHLAGAVSSASNAAKGYINAGGPDTQQLRGMAWGLRELAQCGKWLPDANSLQSYFSTIAQNNLDDHDSLATVLAIAPSGDIYGNYLTPNTALTAEYPAKRPEDNMGGAYDSKTWVSGFEQPYMAIVLHFTIKNQGWNSGTTALNGLKLFWSRLADVNQIPAGFDITFLSPYVIAVGSRTYGPSYVTFYTTLTSMYAHTYSASAGGSDGPITGRSEQNAPFIRALLMMAAADGTPGGSAGVTYLNRIGGGWDSQYRTLSEYTPFAFSSVAVLP